MKAAKHVAPAAFLVMMLTLLHISGIPVFQQDWIWPFDRANATTMFSVAGHVWTDVDSGSASAAPNGIVAAWLFFGSAAALGPSLGLNFLLLLFLCAAFAGMFLYLRARGAEFWPSTLGAALYTASPVFYNKLQAGHYYYLLGYAVFPCGFALLALARQQSETRIRVATVLLSGALFGLAAEQFQFAALAFIALFFESLTWGEIRTSVLTGGCAACIMVFLHVPDYAIMLAPQSERLLLPQATPISWLDSQSQGVLSAMTSVTYIGGYAQSALFVPIALVQAAAALTVAGGVAAAGLYRTASSRLAIGGFVIFATAVLIVSGLQGPLAAIFRYAFSHDVHFSAFRELYNFSVLTQFGLAMIVGSVPWTRNAGRITSACAFALLLCFVSLYVVAPPGKTIPQITASDARSIAASVRALQGRGRVAFLPTSQSVSLENSRHSGIDSYGQPWAARWPFVGWIDDTSHAYVFAAAREHPSLWSRVGVDSVVLRSNVLSNYPGFLDPYSRAIAERLATPTGDTLLTQLPPLPPPRVPRISTTVRAGNGLWSSVQRVSPDVHFVSIPFEEYNARTYASVGVDPLHGWTQSLRWYGAIPALSCLPVSTIFRITSVSALRPNAADCNWRLVDIGSLACYRLAIPGLQAEGPCAARQRLVSLQRTLQLLVKETREGAGELVYTAESYDSRWELRCGNGTRVITHPVLVDSNAMGWLVPARACEGDFEVSFQPDQWFQATVIALWAMTFACAISLLLIRGRAGRV